MEKIEIKGIKFLNYPIKNQKTLNKKTNNLNLL